VALRVFIGFTPDDKTTIGKRGVVGFELWKLNKTVDDVGLVLFYRVFLGVEVGRAHLRNFSEIVLILCGFAGFSEASNRGRL
jgi:hypothetical protein